MYSFFLNNWKVAMVKDQSVTKKALAFTSLFLELTFGVAALSVTNYVSMMFVVHALVGVVAFFK